MNHKTEEDLQTLLLRLFDIFSQEKKRIRKWETNTSDILKQLLVFSKCLIENSSNGFYPEFTKIGRKNNYNETEDEPQDTLNTKKMKTFQLPNSIKIELLSQDEGVLCTSQSADDVFDEKEWITSFKEENIYSKSAVNSEFQGEIEIDGLSGDILNTRIHECSICPYEAHSTNDLYQHVTNFHNEVDLKFDRKISESTCKLGQNKERTAFPCPHCTVSLSNKKSLQQHIKTVHYQLLVAASGKEIKSHFCPKCNFKTDRQGELDRHIKAVHDKIKDAKCGFCPYKSSRPTELMRHVRFYHEKIYDNQCESCSKRFVTKEKLKRHVKAIHEKIKDEQCHSCPASFASRYNLKQHIKSVHENIKSFQCDKCPYETNRRRNLDMHFENTHKSSEGYSISEYQVNEQAFPISNELGSNSEGELSVESKMEEATHLDGMYESD